MFLELTESIGDAVLIACISSGSLLVMTRFLRRRQAWQSVRSFLQDESGASYAIPYMLAFPIYLIFVCLVVQSTMIILVKIGTMQAAYQAVRSAAVWRSGSLDLYHGDDSLARQQAEHAARITMVPFSSGLSGHSVIPISRSLSNVSAAYLGHLFDGVKYAALYNFIKSKNNIKHEQRTGYICRKYAYSMICTSVNVERHDNVFGKPISVQVAHQMPITLPFTGRIFGSMHWTGRGYTRNVISRATMPLETPESPDGRLGIEYDSVRLSDPGFWDYLP